MRTPISLRHRYEKLFGVGLRAMLFTGGLAIIFREVSLTAFLVATAYVAATSLLGARFTRNLLQYSKSGPNFFTAMRCIDVLLVGFGCYWVPSTPIWLLMVPTVLLEGLASRDARRIAFVSLIGIVGQSIVFTLTRSPLMNDVKVITVLLGTPILTMALSQFRSKEEQLTSSHRRLASLMTTASNVSRSQSLRSLILRALQDAVDDTNATAGYVMLVSEENRQMLVTEAAYGRNGEYSFPDSLEIGSGISGYVTKMAQPIEVHDNLGEQMDLDGMGLSVRSAVSVPIINRSFGSAGQASKEEVLGAMTVLQCETHECLSDLDLEHIMSLGSLMAAAITNARMEERQQATFVRTLESLATALEARDEYTQGHSQRVGDVSVLIGQELGFGPEALEELRIGTTLHDIGKIGVPDAILNKPGRLTIEEFELMKQHPVIGYEICKPLTLSDGVLMIIRNHHEKLDGSGYPDGLKGGELPLSLRVVCVADAFDAMSSRRPYRNVMDINNVVGELSKGAGIQFDPVVVERLKSLLNAGRLDEIYQAYWNPTVEKAA